jgi:hypothetical protein
MEVCLISAAGPFCFSLNNKMFSSSFNFLFSSPAALEKHEISPPRGQKAR